MVFVYDMVCKIAWISFALIIFNGVVVCYFLNATAGFPQDDSYSFLAYTTSTYVATSVLTLVSCWVIMLILNFMSEFTIGDITQEYKTSLASYSYTHELANELKFYTWSWLILEVLTVITLVLSRIIDSILERKQAVIEKSKKLSFIVVCYCILLIVMFVSQVFFLYKQSRMDNMYPGLSDYIDRQKNRMYEEKLQKYQDQYFKK